MNNLILCYDFGDGVYEYEITHADYYDFKKAYLNECTKEQLLDIINECVDDDAFREYVDEDIKDTFIDDAKNEHDEYNDYEKDPYAYYGLKRSDFDGI